VRFIALSLLFLLAKFYLDLISNDRALHFCKEHQEEEEEEEERTTTTTTTKVEISDQFLIQK